MSPNPPGATPDEIAAMLRDGATYREIKQRLNVGSTTISNVRTTYKIAPAWNQTHKLSEAEQRAAVEEKHPRVIAMLQGGATYEEITAATGVNGHAITRVRIILGIPAQPKARRTRTITEAIALHLKPFGDGHARWTGPRAGSAPVLHVESRRLNARREIFRAHHGRAPESRLTHTCQEPQCCAGAHLADTVLLAQRQAEQDLDQQYTAIFGDDAP